MQIHGLEFSDKLDHEGDMGIESYGTPFWLDKEDAEQLIAHLKAVFKLEDQKHDH